VGACVGIRGSRIQNIVQELHGERIDIVVWHPEIATFAANALSPARVTRIMVDEDEKTLEVVVPDDQLTLAIGRKGQNVKLAAKLLGWKIDIFTDSRYSELNVARKGFEQLASVAEMNMENFLSAGFDSVTMLEEASDEELDRIEGMTPTKREHLRSAIRLLLPAQPKPDDALEAEGETQAVETSPEQTPAETPEEDDKPRAE